MLLKVVDHIAWLSRRRQHGQRPLLLVVDLINSAHLTPSSRLDGLLDQVVVLRLQRRHFARRPSIKVPRSSHVPLIPVPVAADVFDSSAVDASKCQALIVHASMFVDEDRQGIECLGADGELLQRVGTRDCEM